MKQKQYCNKFNRDFLKKHSTSKKELKKKSQRTNLKNKNTKEKKSRKHTHKSKIITTKES